MLPTHLTGGIWKVWIPGVPRVLEGPEVLKVPEFGRFFLAHLRLSGGFLKFEVSSSGSGGF